MWPQTSSLRLCKNNEVKISRPTHVLGLCISIAVERIHSDLLRSLKIHRKAMACYVTKSELYRNGQIVTNDSLLSCPCVVM
jgi:hypothetical protein